jgi:hypothetical protein
MIDSASCPPSKSSIQHAIAVPLEKPSALRAILSQITAIPISRHVNAVKPSSMGQTFTTCRLSTKTKRLMDGQWGLVHCQRLQINSTAQTTLSLKESSILFLQARPL